MTSIITSLICATAIIGGIFFGFYLRRILPEEHMSTDSKDTIKMVTGLIATLAALVLGLLVASAKQSFDAMNSEATRAGANIIMLGRVLDHYGPEAKPAREQLYHAVAQTIANIWPSEQRDNPGALLRFEKADGLEKVLQKIGELQPTTDLQKTLDAQALQLGNDLLQSRWLIIEESQNSLPPPLFIVLIFWLTMIYVSIGMFAPSNKLVIVALMICAFSYSAAIFLIQEMNHPLTGSIKLSSGPMKKALSQLAP